MRGTFRYYCSVACYERRHESATTAVQSTHATTAPARDLAGRPSIEQVTDMLGLSRASLPPDLRAPQPARAVPDEPSIDRHGDRATLSSRDRAAVGAALAAAGGCAIVTVLDAPADLPRFAVGVFLALGAAALAVREVWNTRHEAGGVLAWSGSLVGPAVLLGLALTNTGETDRGIQVTLAAAGWALVPTLMFALRGRLHRAHRTLATLLTRLPRLAHVVRPDGSVDSLRASRVRAGEEVNVAAGERVPVDGVVQSGEGVVQIHDGPGGMWTSEAGASILAGSRVVQGPLRVLATRAGDDVALARVSRGFAAGEVPDSIRLAEQFAWGVPLVAALFAVGGIMAHGTLGWQASVGLLAMAWVGTPAAMTIGWVRVPILEAMARAAERGIVFRDAESLELGANVGTAVLCTRGTVTRGRLELVEVVPLGARLENELVGLAAAVEDATPDHPIARAIRAGARSRGVTIEGVRRTAVLPGRGITAVHAGGDVLAVGSRQLLVEEGISVAPGEEVARSMESQGRTVVFVAIAGRVEGVLGLEDPLREEARGAVQALMDAGFDVALLGGESRGTAESIGRALDVVNVRPEVLPDERGGAVRAMAEVAGSVAVIGRPAIDGEALAAADVAVSLAAAGASGGETAIALAGDDLRDAAEGLQCARRARDQGRRARVGVALTLLAGVVPGAVWPAFGVASAVAGVAIATCWAWWCVRERPDVSVPSRSIRLASSATASP